MMKKIYSVLSVLLTIILMGVFVSCERDKEVMLTAVSVTNEQITPMYKSATISSTISSESTIRDVFVQYTVTKDFAEYDEVPMQEKDGIYTAELIDLLDNTTYYYRYAASNRHSAIVLQKIQQFATLQPTAPVIRLDSILTVWDSYAQVQVALEFDGGASVTDMGVCWGTQANPTIEDIHKSTKDTVAVIDITSLQSNTQYYVRAYAVNKVGVAYSEEKTFTTSSEIALPTVTTATVTQITETTAVAGGNVTSDGGISVSERGVVYTLSAHPSISDLSSTIVRSGSGTGAFTCNLSNLQAGTTYYVRAYAINSKGTAYGDEISFTTALPITLATVTTASITNITETTAKAGGTVTNDGNAAVTERGVCISTVSNPTTSNTKITAGSGTGSFTCNLTGLQANTTYYVRAYAVNSKGTAYGEEVSFTTSKQIVLPTVTTAAVTQITETSAVAGGNVTSDGGASVTERGVVYATTQNPTTNNTKVTSGTGIGSFTCNLTNLQPNNTYYVRAYAVNSKGTAYGTQVSFTTNKQIVLPTVTTATVTQITETSAVAGGNVTSDGGASVTERGVVYSTNPTPVITNLNNTIRPCGSGIGAFTYNMTGLQSGTTYYVRAYAKNDAGTAYGEEVSFTTKVEVVDNPPYNSALPFSVSESKQVYFSKGNLQYTQSTNTWSFAENQWDMIGTDNVTGGSVSSDPKYGEKKSGTALADKIDLFGWSTSANNFGVSTSESSSDYSGSFVDWGTNKIGNDAPNTWRTLTYDEWRYLRWERSNYSELCGVAQVNGVNGLILLPDTWTCPSGVTFKSGFHSNSGVDYYEAYQTFTADQWSKLEAAGAVFLPATGSRFGSNVTMVQCYCNYWSATEGDGDYAGYFGVHSDIAGMGHSYRYTGKSVRLVKDL